VLRDLPDQRGAVGVRHPVAGFDALVSRDGVVENSLYGGLGVRLDLGALWWSRRVSYEPNVRSFHHDAVERGAQGVGNSRAGQAGGRMPSETTRTTSAGRVLPPARPGRYHSISELTVPESSRPPARARRRSGSARRPARRHQGRNAAVELPPPGQRPALRLGVAPHAQQQRDVRQLAGQHLDLPVHDVLQPPQRRCPRARAGFVEDAEQPVQRPGQRGAQQFLLATDVVVERRLRDPGGRDRSSMLVAS